MAYADEVLECPALLETAVRAFTANDDLTLVLLAPGHEPALAARLEAIARGTGLDRPDALDVVLVSGESSSLAGVDWVLSRKRRAEEQGAPVVGFDEHAFDGIRATLGTFRCNVCGASAPRPDGGFDREVTSCDTCGSTPRFRSIVHAISFGLFGQTMPLEEIPERRDLVGAGLSDWPGYADRLAERLTYENTYLHRPPFLDITDPVASRSGTLDLLVSSDVFEHVRPPVQLAFDAARGLLRPGGLFVLTVPYRSTGRTAEHFPDLGTFTTIELGGERVLVNRTAVGAFEVFGDLRYHGGDGATLEMRIFSLPDILSALDSAGFVDVQVLDTPCPRFGVDMGGPGGWPIIAYAPGATTHGESG